MNKTSIALGYFDSIHLAHKEILKSCANFSPKTTSLALSFTIDDNLLKHKNSHIISTDDKIKMIQDIGIDRVELPLFSKIANLTADEFFYDILLKKYSAVNLVCGFNYTFGKNALGDTNYLLKLCKKNNISLEIIPQIKIDGISVSTSNIKKFLSDGNIKMANKFLGYTFFLKGEVVKGNKIGRTLDFPTINQNFFENQYIPKYGVYKTSTIVDGITYNSITNIGVKPTVSNQNIPNAETHIIGLNQDLYGKEVTVVFHDFLRSEMKFNSRDELKNQLKEDIKNSVSAENVEKALAK